MSLLNNDDHNDFPTECDCEETGYHSIIETGDKETENSIKVEVTQESNDVTDEIVLPPIPDESTPFYGIENNLTFWGFSQTGESHIRNGLPCQDRCKVVISNGSRSVLIAAIADGVGSCALSHYGASIVTETATSYLKEKFDNHTSAIADKWIGDSLREAMQYAQDAVAKTAREMEQLEYSFQSTLTIAIYDGNTLYMAHVGDDGIVALTDDGKVELVTARIKGEEASSVYPLQSGSAFWQVMKVDRYVNGFVMATDGVLDAFVRGETENNRIYYPFIQPAFETRQTDENHVKETMQFYYDYMAGSDYRKAVTDDLTILVVTNQEFLNKKNVPVFDTTDWNIKTKEYREKVNAALYPKHEDNESAFTEETVDSAEGVIPEAYIMCSTCGEKIRENFQYCPKCGKKILSCNQKKGTASSMNKQGEIRRLVNNSKTSGPKVMPCGSTNNHPNSSKAMNVRKNEGRNSKYIFNNSSKKPSLTWIIIVLFIILILTIVGLGGLVVGKLLKLLLFW